MDGKEDILEGIQVRRWKRIMERVTATVLTGRGVSKGRGMEPQFGNVGSDQPAKTLKYQTKDKVLFGRNWKAIVDS